MQQIISKGGKIYGRSAAVIAAARAGIGQETYNQQYAAKTAAALANITGANIDQVSYNDTTVLRTVPPPLPEEPKPETETKPEGAEKPAEEQKPGGCGSCEPRASVLECAWALPDSLQQ